MAAANAVEKLITAGKGLHSSTFWLNLSASCGIGGAFRGCLAVCRGGQGIAGGIEGVSSVRNGSS